MPLSVPQAAASLDLSQQRVRALIASGRLRATRVGGRWVLDEADLAYFEARSKGRPLSERSAWAVLELSTGRQPEDIAAIERARARKRLALLLTHPEPAALLRSWLVSRADRRVFSASKIDLTDLRADPRLLPSGVSHPDSGISAGDVAEGYIDANAVEALVAKFLLVEEVSGRGNVILHVPRRPVAQVWPLLLAADLAEHRGPREERRAAELVRGLSPPQESGR